MYVTSKLPSHERFLSILYHHTWPIGIFASLLLSVFTIIHFTVTDIFTLFVKTDKFALLLDISLLICVFIIGLKQYYKEWVDSLPNYLTVNFCYQNQLQIKVDLIPLSSLGDIRGQAQSVAQSLNNGTRVALYPMLSKIEASRIEKVFFSENQATMIEHHEVYINLEKPIYEQTPGLKLFDIDVEKEYLFWGYPFQEDSLKAVNRDSQRTQLLTKHSGQ